MALIWRALCTLALAALLPWGAAQAQALQAVPALSGRLIDQTGTLTAMQAASIEQRLRGIEEKSGSQLVVLMVASTAPEDIAAYAWRVASTWKIGRRDVGDGLLIVVAKNDRRMRFEVARALEGAIPDLAAARIIDQQMAPRFRQDDYAGGILAALDQVAARIAHEPLPAPAGNASPAQAERSFNADDLLLFFFIGVVILGPILRGIVGRPLASVITGGVAGAAAYAFTASLLLAGGAAVVALLFTLLGNGRSGGGGHWGGGPGGGFGAGGLGSPGRGGGGFRSGGGGSFGGGGASGSW